jgi:hypothetical protein
MTFRHRTAAALAAATVAATLLAPATTAGAAPAGPGRAAAGSAVTAPILFGLHSPSEQARLTTERRLDKHSALVGFFLDWDHGFPRADYLGRVTTARGAVPVIATGPAGYAPLSRVISGAEDAKAAQWADAVRAYGRPVMIRLMAEMNGPWEPWSTGRNGNTAGQYVLAWRHIVDIFRAHGATNAIWVWNPNRSFPKATPMSQLWPGSDYVNWIGLDVYNFNKRDRQGWLTFEHMVRPSLREIRRSTDGAKPLMINEAGTTEGPRKPAWIRAMYASLARFNFKAAVYFDFNRRRDWRLTNNRANLAASRWAVHHNGIQGAREVPLTTIERIVTTGS